MRSLLEKAIVHLLNEENSKAEELFHKFLVARARQIHEDVRQGDDEALSKDWNNNEEENFSADDLGAVEGGELTADADDDFAAGDDLDDAGDELDAAADDLEGGLGDDDDFGGDGEGEGDVEGRLDTIEDRFDSIQDHLDALTAQFDEIMGDDAEGDLDGDLDGDVDGDAEDDTFDGEGDDTFGGDDTATDDADLGDEGDDFSDEDKDEVVGEGEEFDDITESIVDELEKISVDHADGKEIGSGKTVTQNRKSNLPAKKANPGDAKPVMTKAKENDSFERETAPGTKDVPVKARNTRKNSKDGMSAVSKNGNAGALLNKDYAGKK